MNASGAISNGAADTNFLSPVLNRATVTSSDVLRSTSSESLLEFPPGAGTVGKVILPSSNGPEDQYAQSTALNRQAKLLRMDSIFDEIAIKLTSRRRGATSAVADKRRTSGGERGPGSVVSSDMYSVPDPRMKFASKPVVIGDALPVPTHCPPAVEQLLEAALAHHNLGSFEEALKILEAAHLQQVDIFRRDAEERRVQEIKRRREMALEMERAKALEEARVQAKSKKAAGMALKGRDKAGSEKGSPEKGGDGSIASDPLASARSLATTTLGGVGTATLDGRGVPESLGAGSVGDADARQTLAIDPANDALGESLGLGKFDPRPPVDHELYVVMCKGNIYQSAGDDELALKQYIAGWDRASSRRSPEWESICLNAIGMVCYFNLRYELALGCFSEVVYFRTEASRFLILLRPNFNISLL